MSRRSAYRYGRPIIGAAYRSVELYLAAAVRRSWTAAASLSAQIQLQDLTYRKTAALRHGSNDRNANTAATRTALAKFDWIFMGAYSTTNLESNIANIRAQAAHSMLFSNYTCAQQIGGQISAIGSIVRNGSIVTVNTQDDHGVPAAPDSSITVGSTVTIINSPVATWNADWVVTGRGGTYFNFTSASGVDDTSGEAIACSTSTVVNDVIKKLGEQKGWWLWKVGTSGRRYSGVLGYNAFEMNPTSYVATDSNGDRWPQYKAKRESTRYFSVVDGFDYAFLDNYLDTRADGINDVQYPGQQNYADWQHTGTPQSRLNATILSANRSGYATYATKTRDLGVGRGKSANIKCVANHDSNFPGEFYQSVEAAFLEGIVGRSWSSDYTSFAAAMSYYAGVRGRMLSPQYVIFNALLTSMNQGRDGGVNDFSRATYAYCFAALQGTNNDTFVCIKADDDDDGKHWYDEYSAVLGAPVDPDQSAAWSGTVWRRRFTNGWVLVNSSHVSDATLNLAGQGLKRIVGTDRPAWNNGAAVTGSITIGPWDGIVLLYA